MLLVTACLLFLSGRPGLGDDREPLSWASRNCRRPWRNRVVPVRSQGCPGNGNGLSCLDRNQLKVVMRGLDPRIHAVAGVASVCCEDVDGRIKSDHVRP